MSLKSKSKSDNCLNCGKQFIKRTRENCCCSQICKYAYRKSPVNQARRFWSKVYKTESCWLWTASVDDSGYGTLTRVVGTKKVAYKAHRLSFEIHIGEIPEGVYVCHTCDNPACVNPDHLWLGSQKENMEDASQKGRLGKARGERNCNAKLNLEKVNQIRQMAGSMAQAKIAEIVGVNQTTVSRVILGQTWNHIQ